MSRDDDFTSAPVPSPAEMPFFTFQTELASVLRPIKKDLSEAMEARRIWREAAAMALRPQEPQISGPAAMLAHFEEQTARMSAARPVANVRAAGILVPLQAIMEDLRRTVVGNLTDQFGPPINGVPFSNLLQAGANSCRHGSEWWHRVLTAVHQPNFFTLNDAEQQRLINANLTNEQRRSIEIIVKALGTEQSDAANQPAIDVLWLLCDGGNLRVLRDRMVDTAVEIARAKGRLADYNGAATMLGNHSVT